MEDELYNLGVDGTRSAINFLRSVRDMLRGNSTSKVNITTKWDGAPAIICGIDPENGKFFVGTKSVFGKTPKKNYTNEDIANNHPAEGLASKLRIALANLKDLGIKDVIQGDMMFSKSDLSKEKIDGESFITFQPNTILYAIPSDSELGKRISSANMGIVFHTLYSGGPTTNDMKASFNVDISGLKKSPNVWYQDASFKDVSGTATFTEKESKELTTHLSSAGKMFHKIPANVLNGIADNYLQLQLLLKTYNNSRIRAGEPIGNVKSHASGFEKWIKERFEKESSKVKTEKSKQTKYDKRDEILGWYSKNRKYMENIYFLQNDLVTAKNMIVKKLEKVKGIASTFVVTSDGLQVSAPEGFVAVDKMSGGAVKIVDRMEFSKNNFSADVRKGWENATRN